MALLRKEDTSVCFKEASTYLTKGSQVTISNTPVIDLLTLYPEALPDLMKPSKGTKRRPGSDEHLLAAMQKTSAGLRELREAVRLHPQLACSSDVQGDLPLVPYHAVSEWSKHGSPNHGASNIEGPKSKIRFRADIASFDTETSVDNNLVSSLYKSVCIGLALRTFFGPTIAFCTKLQRPAYRFLQLLPILVILAILCIVSLGLIQLIVFPETWIDIAWAPVQAFPAYMSYALPRMAYRFVGKLGSLFGYNALGQTVLPF